MAASVWDQTPVTVPAAGKVTSVKHVSLFMLKQSSNTETDILQGTGVNLSPILLNLCFLFYFVPFYSLLSGQTDTYISSGHDEFTVFKSCDTDSLLSGL